MRRRQRLFPLTTLLLAVACAPGSGPGAARAPGSAAGADVFPDESGTRVYPRVVPGLEVLLRDSAHLVRGKRVGFLTNQTAVTSTGRSGIDLLAESPDVKLVALYGPEHGLRGDAEGGASVANTTDARTGVPVFSLYGATQRPTPRMLEGVDVLLFDMQDIGARPYTFVWTMAMAMEAAAAQHIPFVVLDRPNPITSRAAGPQMDFAMRNVGQAITGYYPVPLRHGMTVGEVARYINSEYHIGADLTVVPASNWKPTQWFDQTGLPWINPSPNIRSLEAALNYSGVVLFEATNMTVGRGTARPFSYIGAPWLNTSALMTRLRGYNFAGVRLDTVSITPSGTGYVPFNNELVHAVQITVTDRDRYQPVWMALALLSEIHRLQPNELKIEQKGMSQMLGSTWSYDALMRGDDPRTIWARWQADIAAWETMRAKYALYH
jgi:uncharacterized protein YbbC (DUF1343 family)